MKSVRCRVFLSKRAIITRNTQQYPQRIKDLESAYVFLYFRHKDATAMPFGTCIKCNSNRLNVTRIKHVGNIPISWNQVRQNPPRIILLNYPCYSKCFKDLLKVKQMIKWKDKLWIDAFTCKILTKAVILILKIRWTIRIGANKRHLTNKVRIFIYRN